MNYFLAQFDLIFQTLFDTSLNSSKIISSLSFIYLLLINFILLIKPVFVINKDAMAPSKGEYRFTSGGKEYVVKGFQGSTLKHEIFQELLEILDNVVLD